MTRSDGACGRWLKYLQYRMLRQKEVGQNDMKTELRRCLNTAQLTMLGVGSTIGVGIYVLLGVVAKENAGPSVIICFLAAILVTLVNALVYAEFASYVPQTGALYIYIYKVAGEFAGFLCGWMLFVGNIMGGSVGARAWSGMVDSFFNNSIQAFTVDNLGKIEFGTPFAESLDLVAFFFQLFIIVIVSCNVFCSSIINTVLGFLTTSVLIFVFLAGLILGDADNFLNKDHGGFFPFGVSGVVKGASLALYATVGFEVIPLSAEEAKNPSRAVPRAILFELSLVGVVYLGAAVGLLFLCPYWLLDLRSPLPSAFEHSGVIWGKYIVTIGPLFGITNLQMLGLYGASRILYRMAVDGLFFSCFLKVDKKSGVPRNSVVFIGVLIAFFSLLFDLSYVVKVTVLLMLIGYICLGSALIKLKITESSQELKRTVKSEKQLNNGNGVFRSVVEYYDHEVTVSENQDDENYNQADAPNQAVRFDLTNGNDAARNAVVFKADGAQASLALNSEIFAPDTKMDSFVGEVDSDSLVKNVEFGTDRLEYELTPTAEISPDGSQPFVAHENVGQVPSRTVFARNSGDEELPGAEVSTSGSRPKGFKQRMASDFSVLVPGVISVNSLLLLHFIACFTLASQITFGWQDLLAKQTLAVTAMIILGVLLLIFSFLLWLQCGHTQTSGFQTPLMPLVPTLGMIFSSIMLLSAGELVGLIEVSVVILTGSLVYFFMIFMSGGPDAHYQRVNSTERRALVNDGDHSGEADDEIDVSDDDL